MFIAPVARAHRARQAADVGHRRQRARCPATARRSRSRGNVRARPRRRSRRSRQPANGPAGPVTFTTECLHVVPKKGRAEPTRPVTIEEPRGIIHGRRDGARQQGQDAQAQVRRPRHAATPGRLRSDVRAPASVRRRAPRAACCRRSSPRARVWRARRRARRDRPIARSRSTIRPTPATSTTRRKIGALIGQRHHHAGHDDDPRRQDRPSSRTPTTRCRRPRTAIRSRFRQKRDGVDEYYEGFAQRAEYDGTKQLLELFDRALLKRGQDEIRSNYISYNAATELFKAEGRPASAPRAPKVRGAAPRARRVPAEVATRRCAGKGQGRGEGARREVRPPAASAPPVHAAKRRPLKPRRARAMHPPDAGDAQARDEQALGRPPARSATRRAPSSTTSRSTSASGEVVGLLGPNGAGKTTCFYMIVGLVAADGGRIELDGENLSRLPIHRARAARPCRTCRRKRRSSASSPSRENVRAILELQDLDADALANRLDALLEDLSISHLRRRAGAVAVRRRAPPRARSRARSRRGRASSCSTSRSPASIRSPCSTSRRSSASSRSAASAC